MVSWAFKRNNLSLPRLKNKQTNKNKNLVTLKNVLTTACLVHNETNLSLLWLM